MRVGAIALFAAAQFALGSLLVASSQVTPANDAEVKITISAGATVEKFVEPRIPFTTAAEQAVRIRSRVFVRPDGWVANDISLPDPVGTLGSYASRYTGAASAALRQWRFQPIAGAKTSTEIIVYFDFPVPPPHNGRELIASTPLVEVRADDDDRWCETNSYGTYLNASFAWKVSPDAQIGPASETVRKTIRDLWPQLAKACPGVQRLFVSNYVHGVRLLTYENVELPAGTLLKFGQTERPLNQMNVTRSDPGGDIDFGRDDKTAERSLAAVRTNRKHPALVTYSYPDLPWDAPAAAPPPPPRVLVTAPAAPDWPDTVPKLGNLGLKGEEPLTSIYLGRFERIPQMTDDNITRVSDNMLKARNLFVGYVEEYSRACDKHLPPGSVGIQQTVTRTLQTVNGYNTVVGEVDLGSETSDTGIRVAPEFVDAYLGVSNSAKSGGLAAILNELGDPENGDLGDITMKVLNRMLNARKSMRETIAANGCASPQLKRLSANLLAYVKLEHPAQRFDGFAYYCSRHVSSYLPGAKPANCSCLQSAYKRELTDYTYRQLEDEFTEPNLLSSAFRKVGLREKVAACLG